MFWKDFNQNVSDVKEKRTREVLDLLNDSLGTLIFEKIKMEILIENVNYVTLVH